MAGEPLDWFDDVAAIPIAIAVETGGAGDDLTIETSNGPLIEAQAKHRLRRGKEFQAAILRLFRGLKRDTSLRGVLLVDTATSGPIRDELRRDVERLAQGRVDGLRDVTQKTLDLLKREGLDQPSLFERFRVIVRDLDEASTGRDAATARLRPLLESTTQTATAWTVLAKEGHLLAKNRGRRNVQALAALMGRHVTLRGECKSLPVVAEKYRTWLLETNADFFVAGLNLRLPITDAWNHLRLLDDRTEVCGPAEQLLARRLAQYHEWERLADEFEFGAFYLAEDLLQSQKRLVIVATPGAGKSPLQRRLTHWAARQGKTSLQVSLRLVARLTADGAAFEDALLVAATQGAGIDREVARTVLSAPDYLFADGLDECDPDRLRIAREITAWASGHPACHVCVTSRPVGHHPDLLPGFAHAELLPLGSSAIRDLSRRFFRETSEGEGAATASWLGFLQQIEDQPTGKRAASIAARNPLLLSLLVTLFVNGQSLDGNRATLLGQIVDLLRQSPHPDRVSEPELDSVFAARALEAIGWELANSPVAPAERVADSVAEHIALALRLAKPEVDRVAERAIRFWEGRRLIERLTAGHLQTWTFVHQSLAEFAAARFIQQMSGPTLHEWIDKDRRDPRWREPILLACGTSAANEILRRLLELDQPNDPCSTEAVLAAAAMTEAEHVDDELIDGVLERLRARLSSPIPLVAIETGEALCGLAQLAPERLGPVATELLGHEQPWTRLASITLCLLAGPTFVNLGDITAWLGDFRLASAFSLGGAREPETSGLPAAASDLQHRAVPLALERLFAELDTGEAASRVKEFATGRHISLRMREQVVQALRRHDCADQADCLEQEWLGPIRGSMGRMVSGLHKRSREALRAFCEAALVATKVRQESAKPPVDFRPIHLSLLFAGLGLPEVAAGDVLVLADRKDEAPLQEVVRGAILALGLDARQLSAEASLAISWLDAYEQSVHQLLPHVSPTPVWDRVLAADLDCEVIVSALRHPSRAIAIYAAELLAAGVGGERAEVLILEELNQGYGQTLELIAAIASDVWGRKATTVLLDRLGKPLTQGCEHVYRKAAELASPDEKKRVLDSLAVGLESDDACVASGAAEALQTLRPSDDPGLVRRLRHALEHWTRRGSSCQHCGITVHDGSCPECHIVPPTLRASLVHELARLGRLTTDELLQSCEDPWHSVREAATACLTDDAAKNLELLRELLRRAPTNGIPGVLVDALLALPADILKPASDDILALLESQSPHLRSRAIATVDGAWIEPEDAIQVAQNALEDPHPMVRNQATRMLRVLGERERARGQGTH